jgi:hypothetical protein
LHAQFGFGALMFGYVDVSGQNYRMMNAVFNIFIRPGGVNSFLSAGRKKSVFPVRPKAGQKKSGRHDVPTAYGRDPEMSNR